MSNARYHKQLLLSLFLTNFLLLFSLFFLFLLSLVVLSVLVMVIRTIRDKHAAAASEQLLSNFQEFVPAVYNPAEDESEDITASSEIQPPATPTDPSSSSLPLSKKAHPLMGLATTSIRRNHSDLVLQSLLSEEEFAEVLQDPPTRLSTLNEDESMGISPKIRSKSSAQLQGSSRTENQEPAKVGTSATRSSAGTLRGSSLRTSATNKDSVAMNLAIHNLNQMSLKIQQMQQGK